MIRCLGVIAILWSSFSMAQWPAWIGDELKPTASSHWQMKADSDGVEFVPVQSVPRVLVIMSRKAASYDVALQTLLDVYARKLPQTRISVKKLPVTKSKTVQQEKLKHLLLDAEDDVNLIYTVGSKATVAVRHVYRGGKIPVVSVNAKDPVQLGLLDSYQGSGDNFAFTSLNLPADVILKFMKRFKPSLRQIGVLYAKNNQSAYRTQYLPLKAIAEQHGVNIVPIIIDETTSFSTLKVAMTKAITTLKYEDPTLTDSLLWLTGSSSLLSRMAEINRYAGGLAVISAVPDVVRGGQDSALMSFGVSFVNNAHQAGLYGLQILQDNVNPGDLPVGHISPPDIAVSFEQAQRINQKIPFVLMEMASKVYDTNGRVIRSKGQSMQEQQ